MSVAWYACMQSSDVILLYFFGCGLVFASTMLSKASRNIDKDKNKEDSIS
jgi:hypothetical protein